MILCEVEIILVLLVTRRHLRRDMVTHRATAPPPIIVAILQPFGAYIHDSMASYNQTRFVEVKTYTIPSIWHNRTTPLYFLGIAREK